MLVQQEESSQNAETDQRKVRYYEVVIIIDDLRVRIRLIDAAGL